MRQAIRPQADWGSNQHPLQDDSAERVILVDAEDRECGTAPKLDAHAQGLRHRAFSVIVRDPAGRVLLQRRAREKYHSGGLWSNACCGHPRPGEETAAAAARRLEEELGFRCPLGFRGKILYGIRFDNGLAENEVVSVFTGVHTGPIAPARAEVEEVAWLEPEALVADAAARPDAYTYWFALYLSRHRGVLGV